MKSNLRRPKTSHGLPPNHFAILFEGAWTFTPQKDEDPQIPDRILAACPLPNDGVHEFEFGTWCSDTQELHKVCGFDSIEIPPESSFCVKIEDMICNQADTFADLFEEAAEKYPFAYLQSADAGLASAKPDLPFVLRSGTAQAYTTVSIPLPTSVRAAGALVTAEIGGSDKGVPFGGTVTVKRPFVTLVFIYEYDDSLTACLADEDKHHGEIVAEPDDVPQPHLIFKVFPIVGDGKDSKDGKSHMAMMNTHDDSAMKAHTVMTFDTVRRAIVLQDPEGAEGNPRCCDIAVYLSQENMQFNSGDTGLSRQELGLALPTITETLHGRKLSSCAGGMIVAGK